MFQKLIIQSRFLVNKLIKTYLHSLNNDIVIKDLNLQEGLLLKNEFS